MYYAPIKEGKEVMEEPEGRWFAFNITNKDFLILEKKDAPPHLASIESLDSAVTLQSLLMDLQDAGEVASRHFSWKSLAEFAKWWSWVLNSDYDQKKSCSIVRTYDVGS